MRRHSKRMGFLRQYRKHPRKLVLHVILPGVVLVLIAMLGVTFLNRSDAATVCTVSDKLVNSCRPWLGAWAARYPGIADDRQAQLLHHEARIGRKVDLVKDYLLPGQTVNNYDRYFHNRPDTYLMLTWRPVGDRWANADGRNAAVTQQIDRMADSIKALGPKKVFLSLHHEPENDVSPGTANCSGLQGSYGSPAEYRAMWAHVHRRFELKGVENVVWSWIVMGYKGWSCMYGALYPGNEHVDWIWSDPYGNSDRDPFDESVGWWYDWMTANTSSTYNFTSKTWGIAETSVHLTTKANAEKYWQDARAAVVNNKYPRIKAYIVFDSPNGKPDNRIMYWCDPATAQQPSGADGQGSCGRLEVDANEQNAYKAFANDPRFTNAFYMNNTGDTVKPTVSLTAPASNSSAVVGASMTLSAAASDNVGVTKVEFYNGATLLNTDTTAPYGYAWGTTGQTAGIKTLTAKAYDAAGNATTSSAVSLTLTSTSVTDKVPPTATLTLSPFAIKIGGSVTASVSASDNVGVTKVEISSDGVAKGVDTTAPYSVTWPAVSIGTKSVAAKVYDAAGNVTTVTQNLTISSTDIVVTKGDANGDQRINSLDYSILLANDGKSFPAADFDKDGTIGAGDLAILLFNWTW